MYFKTALSKKHLNIAPSENAFQKKISKLLPPKMYFKNIWQIAPSKNVFQDYYQKVFVSASYQFCKKKKN